VYQDPQSTQSFSEQVSEFVNPDVFTSWEFWLVAAVVLLIGEILTAGFLLGAFLPGAVIAALLAALGLGMQAQLIGFAVGTLVGLLLLRPMLLRKLQTQGEPTNVDALHGQLGQVTEGIAPGVPGRVKLQSEEWRASASNELAKGTQVRVLAVEGNTLQVEASV
jgi:membrane protein implicated in regulation of membrane protease activity